jgi:hypothetical protein
MTQCEECIAVRAAVYESLKAYKREADKHRDKPWMVSRRLCEPAFHQLLQAQQNELHHHGVCTGRQP